MSAKTLSGKIALVTGGSRGIGAAIAKRLAAEGAAVAITYSSGQQKADEVVRLIQSGGGRSLAIRADNTDAGAVKNAVAETVRTFGRLDELVNNAGIAVVKPLDEFSLEDFDRSVAVNVRAVFVAAQEAARHMQAGGRIITIGSVNADRMPFAGGGVYAMTKAAVNVVQPGPVETDMNPADGPFAETLKAFMAIKRYGNGDEIAGMVAYLASPQAAFVTGSCLTIDGGFAA